jgi:hypothetical protein
MIWFWRDTRDDNTSAAEGYHQAEGPDDEYRGDRASCRPENEEQWQAKKSPAQIRRIRMNALTVMGSPPG